VGIQFTLNGKKVDADRFDPHTTLLEWLRNQGLTGSKEGCAEGECGACAVAMVGYTAQGQTHYQAVNSCLTLLASCHQQEIVTVEGIGTPQQLHPVQQAMLAGGSQCGYCTPGFVVSMFAEYYRPGRQTFDLEALGGNLCRCTGYRPIRQAALELGSASSDIFQQRLDQPAPALSDLHHSHGSRQFLRPTSLSQLFDLLEEYPAARLIAGGTDLVVEANLRHTRWPTLISLEALPELQSLQLTDQTVEIGASVPLVHLEERLPLWLPIFGELLPLYASRLLRTRATLGGNLATASPIGDSAPVLLALDAQLRLGGAQGQRQLPLSSFFTGFRQTALQPGEVIQSVLIPRPAPRYQRYYKVAKRGRDDISTVALAIGLHTDSGGSITQARLGLGGVAATPSRAPQTEAFLTGQPLTSRLLNEAALILANEFQPISDHRGSADYRRAMLSGLLQRFAHQEVPA
jgi:xanthine dehydrogenase small subunit